MLSNYVDRVSTIDENGSRSGFKKNSVIYDTELIDQMVVSSPLVVDKISYPLSTVNYIEFNRDYD